MIDLHTHILFGVDDGAKSLDESLFMLETAQKIGIKSIVLTPHVSKYRPFYCSNKEVHEKFELLKQHAKHLDIDLYLGAEIDEEDSLIKTITQNCTTINNSKYVLIDFSIRHADISEVIYELKHYDYKVIIAHPERIHYVDYEELVRFKKEGALLQVTSKHLLGIGDKKACKVAKRLLKDNLIDLVSSDAHDVKTVLTMKKAFDYLSKKKGLPYANKLFVDNPLSIIQK